MDGEDILASSAFIPLPFRVLGLVGLGILCWATNLHILHLLGIDTANVLETRPDKLPLSLPPSPQPVLSHDSSSSLGSSHQSSASLHRPVYRLLIIYSVWVIATYVAFKMAINGDMKMMDRSRSIATLASIGALTGLFCPFNILQKRERDIFLVALRRCLFPSSKKPVYFCDVILADILTSFAKVLGDIWVSTNMLMPGGSLLMAAVDLHGWSEWMVPALISLPFVIRFRQCLAEYSGSGYTNTRPLFNAIKYASSFPVIFLSAMQKMVVADITAAKGAEEALHTTWHGEHRIFRLCILDLIVVSAVLEDSITIAHIERFKTTGEKKKKKTPVVSLDTIVNAFPPVNDFQELIRDGDFICSTQELVIFTPKSLAEARSYTFRLSVLLDAYVRGQNLGVFQVAGTRAPAEWFSSAVGGWNHLAR
ncbi:hypothetical protein FRB98_001013 [Tulasnella sp. 332]|nr:hypothetical protein FRB98_001013 [Tulasnella sp. 332]